MISSTARDAGPIRVRHRPRHEPRPNLPAVAHVLSREVVGHVVERVAKRVIERARASGSSHDDVVLETLHAERQRLSRDSTDRRSARDQEFWVALRRELVRGRENASPDVVRCIVKRYAEEVAGDFDPRVYRLATKVVPSVLGFIARGQADGTTAIGSRVTGCSALETFSIA